MVRGNFFMLLVLVLGGLDGTCPALAAHLDSTGRERFSHLVSEAFGHATHAGRVVGCATTTIEFKFVSSSSTGAVATERNLQLYVNQLYSGSKERSGAGTKAFAWAMSKLMCEGEKRGMSTGFTGLGDYLTVGLDSAHASGVFWTKMGLSVELSSFANLSAMWGQVFLVPRDFGLMRMGSHAVDLWTVYLKDAKVACEAGKPRNASGEVVEEKTLAGLIDFFPKEGVSTDNSSFAKSYPRLVAAAGVLDFVVDFAQQVLLQARSRQSKAEPPSHVINMFQSAGKALSVGLLFATLSSLLGFWRFLTPDLRLATLFDDHVSKVVGESSDTKGKARAAHDFTRELIFGDPDKESSKELISGEEAPVSPVTAGQVDWSSIIFDTAKNVEQLRSRQRTEDMLEDEGVTVAQLSSTLFPKEAEACEVKESSALRAFRLFFLRSLFEGRKVETVIEEGVEKTGSAEKFLAEANEGSTRMIASATPENALLRQFWQNLVAAGVVEPGREGAEEWLASFVMVVDEDLQGTSGGGSS